MPPSQGRYDFAQPGGRVTVGQGALQSRAFEFSKTGHYWTIYWTTRYPSVENARFQTSSCRVVITAKAKQWPGASPADGVHHSDTDPGVCANAPRERQLSQMGGTVMSCSIDTLGGEILGFRVPALGCGRTLGGHANTTG
jgi:hypothetical protein